MSFRERNVGILNSKIKLLKWGFFLHGELFYILSHKYLQEFILYFIILKYGK